MNDDENKPLVAEPEPIRNTEPLVGSNTLLVTEPVASAETVVEPGIVTTPAAIVEPAVADPVKRAETNTPGVIILQWLSYAFWGWLILALIWLVSVILANTMLGVAVSGLIPYAIAAGVVLLPIAFLTDFFYRKHEPAQKTGVAMVIMVIHAVLFALLTIVSLIVAVFNSLRALIETSSSVDGQLVIIFTAVAATLLYAATFMRVLNPFKTNKLVFAYSLAMGAATLILIFLAVAGPLVQALATKDDRRIEQSLSSVSQDINNYIQANEKLPTSLSQVSFTDDEASRLVKDSLVNYTPEKSIASPYNENRTEHRYQLCVIFKDKNTTEYDSYTYSSTNDDYSSYPRVSGHAKGKVCYKLSETTSGTSVSPDTNQGVEFKGSVLN